jgi:hypothetical protein
LGVPVDPSAGRGEDGQGGGVLISLRCRALRRQLRPLAWMVLEDVALDAVVEDGRLVARTSARRLAEQLGIDPGTAANALGQLRRRGLLALEREPGRAGRFGLAVYVLGDVEGLVVVARCGAGPQMAGPDMVRPCAVDADMASTATAALVDAMPVAGSARRPDRAAAAPSQEDRMPLVVAADQGTLDLSVGSA